MEIDYTEDSESSILNKKRHKHKKHKKKRIREDSDASVDVSMDEDVKVKSPATPTPATITFEKTKNTPKLQQEKSSTPNVNVPNKPNPSRKKRIRGRDSGTSSEEERWLDAIESGKLEDVDDELKKIKPKDPKLMTARQRAMYERGTDKESSPAGEALMSLPTGYKEKVMTAEAIQKAALKSQKRKQLADEKREKDKKRTMERLLKKQESKTSKMTKIKIKKSIPLISYKQNSTEITLSFPDNVDFPMNAKTAPPLPEKSFCSVPGCNNLKKYSCSQTNSPLCSLQCYKVSKTQLLAQ